MYSLNAFVRESPSGLHGSVTLYDTDDIGGVTVVAIHGPLLLAEASEQEADLSLMLEALRLYSQTLVSAAKYEGTLANMLF